MQEAAVPDQETMNHQERFLIVGLGNPGREYKGNRHNVGFMSAEKLAAAWGGGSSRMEQKAITLAVRVGDRPIVIARPQTFMNRSGDAVQGLLHYYKIPPERLLVIVDDLDLPCGTVRLRSQGGAGGHNGMRSIIGRIGPTFARLRLGIGRPPGRMPVEAYVLRDFDRDEQPLVAEMLAESVRIAETFIRDGVDLAMTRHNPPRPKAERPESADSPPAP
jgi:PTH1 family peptidyl-tRNA hydrolase